MNEKQIEILKREYAHLIVKFGLNINKDSLVEIEIPTDDIPFVRIVVEELYKAGAKRVVVRYVDDYVNRLHYLYGNNEELKTVYGYQMERLKLFVKEKSPVLICFTHHFDSTNGVDLVKVDDIITSRRKMIYDLRSQHMFNCHWSGFAIPSVSWGEKLFPNLKGKEALNKLWEVIFKCCHIEEGKSIQNWKKHDALLKKRAQYLDSLNIKSLHYQNKLGTDLTIETIDGAKFIGGGHYANDGFFNPNFPTEEVFTCPDRNKTNGVVYSSKPLIVDDVTIEDFSLTFKDGRIVEVHAKKGERKLKKLIDTDEGSHYLGEAALVPFSSPINKTGIIFNDSLYDENACCHLAFGFGIPNVFANLTKKQIEELYKNDFNFSSIHIDFMIGTKDLSIVATTKENKKVVIFKNGEWAK